MRTMTRAGFTLLELLIGMVMLAVVSGIAVVVSQVAGGTAVRQSSLLTDDRTAGAVQAFLQQELRNAAADDLSTPRAGTLGLSRPVGEGWLCAISDTAVWLPVTGWLGVRQPEPGRDAAALLVDSGGGTWRFAPIAAVTSDRCPTGAAAWRLSVAGDTAPVLRIFEPVELESYRSGTAEWFGLAPASHLSPVQPFAGPIRDTASFVIDAGAVTAAFRSAAAATTVQIPLRR
ncbi:MAG: PulJ/GspJ family protein [Gemmatimonadales bacterium]